MSKIIQVNKNSIQRYFPDKKIFDNIVEYLRKNHNGHSLIAGGAVRYMLSINKYPSPADDIDIYLLNSYLSPEMIKVDFVNSVFNNSFKSKFFSCLEPLSFEGKENLSYCIETLVCRPYFPNIQFISINYLHPDPFGLHADPDINKPTDEDILNTFDFTVCQAAIFPYSQNDLICKVSEDFIQDEKNRRLNLTGKMSDALISRVYKYIKLGYRLTEESYIYILNHLQETKSKDELKKGHDLLRGKRQNKDFVIAPYAQQLYEKWISSMR